MAEKIILKTPGELIPYEFNNKTHNEKQIDLIANSISELGFQNPILIDEQNVIIAGHGRLEAAKKLDMKQVPCIVVTNLTGAQIKKLRILDNRIGDFAEYDIENLKIELEDLGDGMLNDLFIGFFHEGEPDVVEQTSRTGYIKLKSKNTEDLHILLPKIQAIVQPYDTVEIKLGGTMSVDEE